MVGFYPQIPITEPSTSDKNAVWILVGENDTVYFDINKKKYKMTPEAHKKNVDRWKNLNIRYDIDHIKPISTKVELMDTKVCDKGLWFKLNKNSVPPTLKEMMDKKEVGYSLDLNIVPDENNNIIDYDPSGLGFMIDEPPSCSKDICNIQGGVPKELSNSKDIQIGDISMTQDEAGKEKTGTEGDDKPTVTDEEIDKLVAEKTKLSEEEQKKKDEDAKKKSTEEKLTPDAKKELENAIAQRDAYEVTLKKVVGDTKELEKLKTEIAEKEKAVQNEEIEKMANEMGDLEGVEWKSRSYEQVKESYKIFKKLQDKNKAKVPEGSGFKEGTPPKNVSGKYTMDDYNRTTVKLLQKQNKPIPKELDKYIEK